MADTENKQDAKPKTTAKKSGGFKEFWNKNIASIFTGVGASMKKK
ncbi:hypothetical protein ACFLTW_05510 [Chloroflexota bacterium]